MSGMQQRAASLHDGSEGLSRVLTELCSSAGRCTEMPAAPAPESAAHDTHPLAHAYFAESPSGHMFLVNPGAPYRPKNGVLWSVDDAQPLGGVEALCLTPGLEEPSSMHTLSQGFRYGLAKGVSLLRPHVYEHGIHNLTDRQRAAIEALEELHGPIMSQTVSPKVPTAAGKMRYRVTAGSRVEMALAA